jgi:hypothetical protein
MGQPVRLALELPGEACVESFFETEIGDEDIGKDPDSVIISSYIDYAVHNREERLTLEGLVSD